MTWLEAIIYVLQNNRQEDGTFSPMHYSDITNAIIDRNLRDTYGITPQNTVSATLTQHPELFRRLGLGLFDLTPKGINHRIKELPQAVPTADEERKEVQENNDPRLGKEIKEAIRSKIIKVFGMFWDRSKIDWSKSNVKLLGQQNPKSDPVDFRDIRGIYLLYDQREVIYVGQAIDSPIVKRLKDHTRDRLSGRWNRFSWFGLDGINPDGTVSKAEDAPTIKLGDLANALEGIMIEGLEPRQNRKQGDQFGDEYLQAVDYAIQKEQALKVCMGLLGPESR